MFKKNTAITGFPFGLVSSVNGSAITTGTVTVYYVLDGGVQGTVAGVPVHEGNGQWSVNLLAAEMNGDVVGLIFTHASAINASFTIKTTTKLVSELNDIAATAIVSSGAITTSAGEVSTVTTLTNKTGFSLASTGLDAIVSTATGVVEIAKATWDRVLTAATHNISTSAGRRVREISAVPMLEGTINDASPTTTSFATTLTGYGNSFFSDTLFTVEYAADNWQSRPVATYTSTTGVFTFDDAFSVTPSNSSRITVQITHIHTVSEIKSGLATSTALATAQADLDIITGASGVNLLTATQASIDAILVDTGTTLQAELDAIQAAVITNAAGADIAADIIAMKADTAAVLIDTGTTLPALLPTALVGGRMDSNTSAIAGSATAASNLSGHALRAIPVSFAAGGTTTTAVFVNVDGAVASSTDDVYNGRVLVFSAPAGLKDQACTITDYTGATKTATISAVTAAPIASAAAIMV